MPLGGAYISEIRFNNGTVALLGEKVASSNCLCYSFWELRKGGKE